MRSAWLNWDLLVKQKKKKANTQAAEDRMGELGRVEMKLGSTGMR